MPDVRPPRVSVVIPAYNHDAFIQATVESIWSQTYSNLEIVVVDDVSTDRTFEVLVELQKRSPIPMVVERHARNCGITRTLNDAVKLSSGELICSIDSDDQFAPHRFEPQVQRLLSDPELMVVYGNGRHLLPGGALGARVHSPEIEALLSKTPAEILERLYRRVTPIFLPTMLMRRSFLDEIGGFDEAVMSNDWALNIRAFQRLMVAGRHAYIDQDCFWYRQHDRNMHKDFDAHSKLILQVFDRYTPPRLRRQVLADAYWDRGTLALDIGRPGPGLAYLARSQWHRPSPPRLASVLYAHKGVLLGPLLPSPILSYLRRVWHSA